MLRSAASALHKRPLDGIRVVELQGLAPGPFAGMILSDFGAQVVRVDRVKTNFVRDMMCRGKQSIALDLKEKEGRNVLGSLISKADVVIDPYRPGVLDRLGFDWDTVANLSKGRTILAHMTGFRRDGQYARVAGHDLNYIALSGVLSLIRPPGLPPIPPNNLLGDFAGGGLMCALGILLALMERNSSGLGQVVDANMVTGTRYLSSASLLYRRPSAELTRGFSDPVGENLLDGGSPFYHLYETSDKRFISLAALEPQFYAEFCKIFRTVAPKGLNLQVLQEKKQQDRKTWKDLKILFEKAFITKTMNEWTAIFADSDACVFPVLEPWEVGPDGATRYEDDDVVGSYPEGSIPEPAPMLSRTPGVNVNCKYYGHPNPENPKQGYFLHPGQHTRETLGHFGYSDGQIENLISKGAVQQSTME